MWAFMTHKLLPLSLYLPGASTCNMFSTSFFLITEWCTLFFLITEWCAVIWLDHMMLIDTREASVRHAKFQTCVEKSRRHWHEFGSSRGRFGGP